MRAMLILYGLLLSLVCCKDDDNIPIDPIDLLPPITTAGNNTFGCLINGEAFVTDRPSESVAIYQGMNLQLAGEVEGMGRDETISIILEDVSVTEEFYLLTQDFSRSASYFNTGITPSCLYWPENLIEGTVDIILFTQNPNIVAGTFEFITVTEDCDTIRVTDGRFDISFTQ